MTSSVKLMQVIEGREAHIQAKFGRILEERSREILIESWTYNL